MHRETHPDTPHTTHTSVSLACLVHKKKIITRIVSWPLKKKKIFLETFSKSFQDTWQAKEMSESDWLVRAWLPLRFVVVHSYK